MCNSYAHKTHFKCDFLSSIQQIKMQNVLNMLLTATLEQIGVGDEVNVDELMDVASEPHEYNIYTVSNYSALTLDVGNRLINAVCNSKHFCSTYIHYCIRLRLFVKLEALGQCTPPPRHVLPVSRYEFSYPAP